MTEKRFQIFNNSVEDTYGILPATMWHNEEQQKKYCDELNNLHEKNQLLEKRIRIYKKDGLDTINDFIRFKEQADEFYREVTETLQKHYDAPYGHRDEKRMLKQIADEIGVDLE